MIGYKMLKINRVFFLVMGIVISQAASSQTYFTRTGLTEFKASVKAFEPVEAKNNSTTVILKAQTGDLAAQLFINAFQFRVALMQEHFNENYMASNEFPKAIFRGKFKDFDLASIIEKKEYDLSGSLTIKGVEKNMNTKAVVEKEGDRIILSATFSVTPKEFGIKIPAIVKDKIADIINIIIAYELVEKK